MGLLGRSKKAKEENTTIHNTYNMEEELDELHNKLANKIISIIPTEWDEFYYLGEVEEKKKSYSSVFYYKDSRTNEYVKSHRIPELYHIDFSYSQELTGICSILLEIYDCFLQRGQKAWDQMKLSVTSSGAFHVDFVYGQMKKSNMGQVGREVIWAYETFGSEPKEGTYMRKILDDYRSM